MALQVGQKVLVAGSEGDGFGEVISYPDAADAVEVAYFVNPVQMVRRRVLQRLLKRPELPDRTRCYYSDNGTVLVGRVLSCVHSVHGVSYHVSYWATAGPLKGGASAFLGIIQQHLWCGTTRGYREQLGMDISVLVASTQQFSRRTG